MDKELKQIIGATIGCVIVFVYLVWAFETNDFLLYKHFSPKYEEVRRETFEKSKAYNDGMIQELNSRYLEYQKTKDIEQKEAIKSVVLHTYSSYPDSELPTHLKKFMDELRGN